MDTSISLSTNISNNKKIIKLYESIIKLSLLSNYIMHPVISIPIHIGIK